jgi:hypothetical protein
MFLCFLPTIAPNCWCAKPACALFRFWFGRPGFWWPKATLSTPLSCRQEARQTRQICRYTCTCHFNPAGSDLCWCFGAFATTAIGTIHCKQSLRASHNELFSFWSKKWLEQIAQHGPCHETRCSNTHRGLAKRYKNGRLGLDAKNPIHFLSDRDSVTLQQHGTLCHDLPSTLQFPSNGCNQAIRKFCQVCFFAAPKI